MSRRWLTSNGSIVLEHTVAKIVVGGIVRPITKAIVVDQGVARQFWPFEAAVTDPRITMTTDPVTINRRQVDPDDSAAVLNVNRYWGFATYANYPFADGNFPCLNPGLTGDASDNGKYLIRVDQLTGDVIGGASPLATWIDFNSVPDHDWRLIVTTPGTATATANLSISQDDGAGNPVASTTVVKPITFNSEVTAVADISWNTLQRDLVENKESVDADVALTFNPSGFATGSADTSGSFNDAWHIDSPAVADPENYTVQVNLVSGDAPTGTLGSPLTLDEVREFTLTATTGETKNNALDVVVNNLIDLGNSVTKRVTMSVSRGTPLPDPDWDVTFWSCTDAGFPQPFSEPATVNLEFLADGSATLKMETTVLPETTFETGTWLSGFSGDLNDYECMINNLSGGGIISGQSQGVWYRMAELFTLAFFTNTLSEQYTFNANVRKVGGLTKTKQIQVNMTLASGGQPS